MDKQKIEINIETNENDYDFKIITDHIKDRNFMFCCELLLLKEYDEFEKKVCGNYWKLDNSYIVIDTLKNNNLEHFKYVLQFIKIINIRDVLLYCLKNSKYNISDYLINYENSTDYQLYCEITSHNDLYYIDKYIKKIKLTPYIIENIISCGEIEYILWIKKYYITALNKKFTFTYELFRIFSSNINFRNIKILGNYNMDFNYLMMENAALNGDLECVKYLYNNNTIITSKTFVNAATSGNFECLEWLCTLKNKRSIKSHTATIYAWDKWTIYAAVEKGIIKNIEWLYLNNCPIDKYTFYNIAKNGNMKLVKWAYKNNIPWSSNTFLHITIKGNLFDIKWLMGYEQIKKNHRYLPTNNHICPFSKETMYGATLCGKLNNIRWL